MSGQSAEGMGPSKKVAKRNAAEKMLDLLGYKVPQPQPPKPALKTDEKVLVHRHQASKHGMPDGTCPKSFVFISISVW